MDDAPIAIENRENPKNQVMPMKREITPHKGGRTVKVSARITPEAKAALTALAVSLGDLIEWAVKEYPKRQERDE
jgi:hypothetical protein